MLSYGFWRRPGRQNHGFRIGQVAKITLSPELDFSPFWLPFGLRFGTENAQQILFWLTLEALVNKKATNICDSNFNASLEYFVHEKVTQGPPAKTPKSNTAAGGYCLGLG